MFESERVASNGRLVNVVDLLTATPRLMYSLPRTLVTPKHDVLYGPTNRFC